MPTLKSLSLPFPTNLYEFNTKASLEKLEIHNEIEPRTLAKVVESFPNLTELSMKLNPSFDNHCLLIKQLKCLRTLHFKLNLQNYKNVPIFDFPNLLNFTYEPSDDTLCCESQLAIPYLIFEDKNAKAFS